MHMILDQASFFKIFPNAVKHDEIYNHLSAAMNKYGITTETRESYFLAQLGHETAGFKYIKELGSQAYFKRYDGRKDLGNTQAGDGARYAGRGFIQLTGRANYASMSKKLGYDLVNTPELACQPKIAALIAGQYWEDRGINVYCDKKDFRKVTKLINGGYNGLSDRIHYLELLSKHY